MLQEAVFVTKGSHIYGKDSTLKMDVANVASPPGFSKFRICCSLSFLSDSTGEDPTRKSRILHWSYSSLTRQLYCKSITFLIFFPSLPYYTLKIIVYVNLAPCWSLDAGLMHFISHVSYKLTKVILGCASDPVKSRVGLQTIIPQIAGNTSDCCR